MAKIPATALEFYISLGPQRSYQAVAKHFGVNTRSVAKRAKKEEWQRRVAEIEAKARQVSEQRAQETLEEMNTRHLKSVRVIQAKALEALRSLPLASGMDAVRALDMALKHERLVRGEPSERTAVTVEDTIKREYSRWLTAVGEGGNEATTQ